MGYKVSYKTYRTKTASGKARANESYSTNVMTYPFEKDIFLFINFYILILC